MKHYLPHLLSIALCSSLYAKSHTPTSHHSPLPQYKEHEFSLATDSDLNTFYWAANKPKKGQTITLDYTAALKGLTATVLSGTPDGKDKIHNAWLQSSEDGKKWKNLSTFIEGKAEGRIPHNAKHLRIAFYADAWSWIAIREIKVGDHPITRSTTERTIQVADKSIPLKITVDREGVEGQTETVDKLIERYFIEWPKIAKIIDAPIHKTPKHLFLRFDQTMSHPAHVAGTTMVIRAKHMINHTQDTFGVFTHELTHFVQNYAGRAPTWFSEGTADYVRFHLHKDSLWARQNLKHSHRRNPLGAYWNSTAFLLWLEETYQKPITAIVSRACSEGKYSDGIWKEITTKTLDQLTKEYQKSQ